MLKDMIVLQETDKEYVLKIPASHKDRAKGIQGRRWDFERKVWTYPKTQDTYEALLAEFGGDTTRMEISSPAHGARAALENQNFYLKKQIEKIEESIKSISSVRKDKEYSDALKGQVEAKARAIDALKSSLEISEKNSEFYQREIDRLREENDRLKQQCSKLGGGVGDLTEAMCKLAISSLGSDRAFELTIKRLEIDYSFSIEFCKIMEHSLRSMLRNVDKDQSLYDLLCQAKDEEVLSEEALDLAHSIRKQRNVVAHRDVEGCTKQIRTLYVLAAATLLWPHLKVQKNN